jgi:hypothetical membrane protein
MKAVPRWAVASALGAPLLLVIGVTTAQFLQPRTYDAIHDTISGLASLRAHDRWVMTAAVAGIGLCYVMTAMGLRTARRPGRVVLAAGGLATLLVAAFPQPLHGGSIEHEIATTATGLTLATWPIWSADRAITVPLLTRSKLLACGAIIIGLTAWLVLNLHGALLGIAERSAALAEATWPLAIAISAARATSKVAPEHDNATRLPPLRRLLPEEEPLEEGASSAAVVA